MGKEDVFGGYLDDTSPVVNDPFGGLNLSTVKAG